MNAFPPPTFDTPPPHSSGEARSMETTPLLPIRTVMERLGLNSIPEHPVHPKREISQRNEAIKVSISRLHCNQLQTDLIEKKYANGEYVNENYDLSQSSQTSAHERLKEQGLDLANLNDLGNGWSIRWSSRANNKKKESQQRVLLQCQPGTSTEARKMKDDQRKLSTNREIYTKDWKRKMPYDFTECLAHIDLTYTISSQQIIRIAGILEHNDECKNKIMKRLPAVPLHPHVFQEAIKQLNEGATADALQRRNQELYQAKLYKDQEKFNLDKANYRYILLKTDLHSLYRKQAAAFGIDILNSPEANVDNWLNSASGDFKKELNAAIFHYRPRMKAEDRFCICIQTSEMKEATWNYAHQKQMIFDGTFGVCDRRLLLFIAFGVDDNYKGIPLAFFLFSAPQGNQATHAGYDTDILWELLAEWAKSMGHRNNEVFTPRVVITDTDIKERGALLRVWPNLILLLCKFHIRQCWTNQQKRLIRSNKASSSEFSHRQIQLRMRKLEEDLIATETFDNANGLIHEVRVWLEELLKISTRNPAVSGAEKYIGYLTKYWLTRELWEGWSQFGRIRAAEQTGIPLKYILPTTNHLEAFNGILKRKYIRRYQRNGHRIRFDLLISLLITQIIPGIFAQRRAETDYSLWLSRRFSKEAGGVDLTKMKQTESSHSVSLVPVTWWVQETDLNLETMAEIKHIVSKGRIYQIKWKDPFTVTAVCASSLAHMNRPDTRQYNLELNCYGYASCSCPFNQKAAGACKHLWALRLILPQLHPSFIFHFPSTQSEALTISESFHSHPRVEPPKNTLSHLAKQINGLVDVGGSQGGMLTEADPDNSSDPEDNSDNSDLMSVHGEEQGSSQLLSAISICQPNTSQAGLKQQKFNRLDQDLSLILPRLHGLYSLLRDFDDIPTTSQGQLIELNTLLHNLQTETSRLCIDEHPTRRIQPFLPQTSVRKLVLPPSPEPLQKRKKTNATY